MPRDSRPHRVRLSPRLVLDERDVTWRFVRAAGPGGQNVNKVATVAQLRYDARAHLPPDVLARLRQIAASRMSERGILTLTARVHRSQAANRREALARLEDLLRRSVAPPTPRTATKPTAASRVRRLETKRKRGEVKARRRRVSGIEE